jgi:hypothetical protein
MALGEKIEDGKGGEVGVLSVSHNWFARKVIKR